MIIIVSESHRYVLIFITWRLSSVRNFDETMTIWIPLEALCIRPIIV